LIKIMTDTTASLSREEYQKFNITPIPLLIKKDREIRRDMFEISPEEFYKGQRNGVKYSTTHIEPNDFEEIFRPVVDDMGHEIICILLSGNISPCVAKANEAIQNYGFGASQISIVDSKQSGFGQAYMALKAKEMADKGVGRDKILETIEDIRSRTHTYFIVETLDHLKAGGRFFWDQAVIASLFKIRPVIWFDRNGKMKINKKISSIKALRERVLDLVNECAKRQIEKIVLHYADNPVEAKEFAGELEKIVKMPVPLIKLSPVIGAHTGPDLLGPVIITKN
jgi:DegV family protein with EDD domain